MNQDDKNKAKKIPKLSPAKAKALELIRKEPNAPMIQIGNKLKELGLIKKPERIYELTRSSRYSSDISGEIQEIRRRNFEMMSREIVPEALKIHKKVLKDKSIEAKDKKDWVSLAEKCEFQIDETRRPAPKQIKVNIGQLQALITKELSKDL